MSIYDEAQAAIETIVTFDADTVNRAGSLVEAATRQAGVMLDDEMANTDAKACCDLIKAWHEKSVACIEEATRRTKLVNSQLNQANAYLRSGQTDLAMAVGGGTATGTVELCDDMYAFFMAFQRCSDAILKEREKKRKTVLDHDISCSFWNTLEGTVFRYDTEEKAYQKAAETCLSLKSSAMQIGSKINEVQASQGGCYVATAVYGSYNCPQVWTLRRYRDYDLAETWHGRAFIKAYYAISPTLVRWFGDTEWFKRIWRGKLDQLVEKCREKGYADTPYEDRIW